MPLPKADLVLRGGTVWCGLEVGTREALAAWGGRVLATGTADEIDGLIGPATCVLELRGRAAVPGFNDARRGILCFTDAELVEAVRDVHARGYQLAVHAIGDRAIEQTLRAIERADAAGPSAAGRRHRIEHLGFATPDHVARMARLGMTTGTQPVFIYDFGELYAENLGESRAAAAYPMHTWRGTGLRPAASTDAPVCDTDPFANLYAMVTRRTRGGAVLGGQERLTLAEALDAYTLAGAHGSFEEGRKGMLEPGRLADIAVLSRDVLAADPEEMLHDTACDLTIQGGRVVFDRQGELTR